MRMDTLASGLDVTTSLLASLLLAGLLLRVRAR